MDREELESMLELAEYAKLLLILYKRRSSAITASTSRRWWVRPLNVDRDTKGYFATTFLKMKETDPEMFFQHTRMTKAVYELLLRLLQDNLSKYSVRPAITEECRLAVTLSYLSEGVCPKFLASSFKMGKSTVRAIIMETCQVIWQVLQPFYVATPNEADYKLIADNFWKQWNMPNCVGAIDGKHINIQQPPNSGSVYYNYKHNFSIVLMGVCDANYTFTNIGVGSYGSQSDGGILRSSEYGQALLNKELPFPNIAKLPNSTTEFPYFLVGDAAFPLLSNLMRPYPGRLLPDNKRIFNYRLSRARRIIENSFGILVARWRILKQTMHLLPESAEKIVLATVALHNFIMLNDATKKYCPTTYVDHEERNQLVRGIWRQEVTSLRSAKMGSNNGSQAAFKLRDELTEYFMGAGSVPFQFDKF